MILLIGIFNYICLCFSGEFDKKQYILLSITPLLVALPLFAISLFISTFFHKTKKTLGISLGISLISYFLQLVSEMNEETEFFKYFTVYTLADIRNVIINIRINIVVIIIFVLLCIIFIVLTLYRYNKKELI